MKAIRLTELNEPLDIDYQLMACELDTSVKNMRCLCKDLIKFDPEALQIFDKLIEDIEVREGIEITSFNDNTILYEYMDEAVVVHTSIADKYIIFDSMVYPKIKEFFNK